MALIKIVATDTLPYIRLTLNNADASPVDVSSPVVVQVKLRAVGSTTVLATLPCATPNGGGDGVVQFNFPTPALDVPEGRYEGEIEINFGGDRQTIYDTLKFYVRAHF